MRFLNRLPTGSELDGVATSIGDGVNVTVDGVTSFIDLKGDDKKK